MKKMLSELILEGAKLRPQGFGIFYPKENGQICSCALGAAGEVITGIPSDDYFPHVLNDSIPWETWQQVWKWNERERISREAIAGKLVAEGLDVEITF